MSYTEFLRRKAAAAPKIIDTTVRSDASTITMRRRLQANREFFTSTRQGVINNVSDPSNTGTNALNKAPTVTTKANGGRIPDASMFTAFMGGDAINSDGGVFQPARRLVANSNDAGSISPCVALDEPVPYLPNGTTLGTVTSSTTLLSASGTTLTVGVSPYTVGFKQKNFVPSSILISNAISSFSITGFSYSAPVVTATVSTTAGIQIGTNVTVTGSTFNNGTFSVTFIGAGFIRWNNAITGATETPSPAATGTFISPNNGSFAVTSVISPYQVTVTNPNAITDSSPVGTVTLTLVSSGTSSNTVPQNASNIAKARESCIQPSTEPHIQTELGGSLFVDDTIRLKHLTSCCVNNNDIAQAIHTHPANVPHNDYQARPLKGNGGIPAFLTPPGTGRKVGGYDYKDRQKYVEKHHGNDNIGRNRVPTKYQIPAGAPAQLKINDPNHYPVA